jgi:hypothetical protein
VSQKHREGTGLVGCYINTVGEGFSYVLEDDARCSIWEANAAYLERGSGFHIFWAMRDRVHVRCGAGDGVFGGEGHRTPP